MICFRNKTVESFVTVITKQEWKKNFYDNKLWIQLIVIAVRDFKGGF